MTRLDSASWRTLYYNSVREIWPRALVRGEGLTSYQLRVKVRKGTAPETEGAAIGSEGEVVTLVLSLAPSSRSDNANAG